MSNNRVDRIDAYQLQIIQTQRLLPAIHYSENLDRRLLTDPAMSHQFLFEVHFENRALVMAAPGKTRCFFRLSMKIVFFRSGHFILGTFTLIFVFDDLS